MTCEDIVPTTTLPQNTPLNLQVVTRGYDWVAVLLSGVPLAIVFAVQIQTDSGGLFNVADGTIPANSSTVISLGGSGGALRRVTGPLADMAAIPFVPNSIAIIAIATPGTALIYGVIGGYLE